jgi:peptidyl-prolyl cis-trans isomerase D
VKIMFGAIVLVFVFFGVGAVQDSPPVVAVVNDEALTPVDYVRTYNNLVRVYQDIFKENFGPEQASMLGLKTRALEQLVSSSLMRQEAERLGLSVGAEEVRRALMAVPSFQVDGRFNKDLYLRIIRINRMTPGDFEEAQRQELLIGKIRDLVTSAVHVGEAVARDRYAYQNEEVNLRFLRFDGRAFEAEVAVTDEEVQTHYDQHAQDFETPERRRVEYVFYAAENFMASAQPTEEAIRAYYEEHLDDYALPERVRARHILFQLGADVDESLKSEVRTKAEEVLAKVKAGEDFAALARESSEDRASADAGGDLGLITRGRMGDEFDAAAFSQEVGTTSDVVETPLGFHIIRIEEKIPEGPDDFENVRGEIVRALKRTMARDLANAEANQGYEKAAAGETLAAVAAAAGLQAKQPEPFASMEDIAELGANSPLASAAFSVEQGQLGPLTAAPNGFFLFRVTEKIPPQTPELGQVRERVETAVRALKAADVAKERAAEALEALKSNGDLDAVAATYGLSALETGAFTRAGSYVPNIGNAPELKTAAFSLTDESGTAPQVYEADEAHFVAVLAERVPVDEEEFQGQKEQLVVQLQRQQEAQVLDEFVDYLQSRATIERNEAYLAGIPDTGRPLPDPRL